MHIRKAVVSGRFYPGASMELENQVNRYLEQGKDNSAPTPVWAVMLPHAGYIFCGDIIGKTLANVSLPSTLIILCPNHTGMGMALGVWPDGEWETPLGPVKIDNGVAQKIIATGCGFQADVLSHAREHSIEVLLPFLQKKVKNLAIAPVCVGTQNPAVLRNAAKGLAEVIKNAPEKIGIVISSDMNHYENEKTTLMKDQLALDAILADDPDALLAVTRQNKISMCGAAPMALALYTAKDLGPITPRLIAHGTSARAAGDYDHTVGYAGMEFSLTPGS